MPVLRQLCYFAALIWGGNGMEIRFIQTSDPVKYRRIIDDTSRTVALYCYLHSYGYEKFVGLKKGVAPVHATFNRVFMLNELIDSGYAGWVAYIDADAYIRDLTFDVTKYLIENQKHAFIAARVPGHQSKWAINAGVFYKSRRSDWYQDR